MVKPSPQRNPLEPPLKSSPKSSPKSLPNWPAMRWLKQLVAKPAATGLQPAAELQSELRIEGVNEATIPNTERDREPVSPSSASSQFPEQPPILSRRWQWPLVWLSAFAVLGGMGTAALVWLISLPPQIDCRHPNQLSLDMERLYCAQEAAQSGDIAKLIAGIDLLKQWQPEHPLHGEAQRLIQDWSEQVLTIATKRVVRGDLKGAEAALSHIPNTTPVYQDVQKALSRWRKYSKRASNLNAKAEAALKQKDWHAVSDYIVLLAAFERDYWELENGADALAQRLGVEKQAWQALNRAQKIATNPEQLAAAIALAQQVPNKTYAADEAKVSLKQWSQKLVAKGNQQWQSGNRLGAISTLRLDPKIVNQPAIEELYQFGNAYRLANPALSSRWPPTMGNLVNFAEAIAAMEQVKSDSPFHNQAQSLRKSWQRQMQNFIQLKYAGAAASFEHPTMLALAVDQAKQISVKEPRRLQAQTLVAYWQKEVERLEDQPIVNRAMRLAKGGTIDSFKAAIAEASQIDLDRTLRQQSQTLIARWYSQIQTLEDRPKLEQATDLAQQGNLEQAIQLASEIRVGRALYPDAQNAIADWRYQQVVNIQIAQDQPLLDQAMTQAAAGQLSAAINTASRIGSGRALSGRAQASIQQWENQLNPPAPRPSQSSPFDSGLDDFNNDFNSNGLNDPLVPTESPSGGAGAYNGGQSRYGQSGNSGEQPSPTISPAPSAFPSLIPPSPILPTEIQTVPPPGTYQPYVPPQDSQSPATSEPPVDRYQSPDPEPPVADPLPPDPLPPRP